MVSQEISFFQTDHSSTTTKNFSIYIYIYELLILSENINLIEKYADSCAWSMEFWNYSNHASYFIEEEGERGLEIQLAWNINNGISEI